MNDLNSIIFNRQNRSAALLLIAPCVFLLILPFSHTVSLRLLSLFALFLSAVLLYRKLDVPVIPLKLPVMLWLLMALFSLSWAVDPAYSLSEIKVEIGYAMLAFFGFFVLARDRVFLLTGLSVILLSALGVSIAIWLRQYVDLSEFPGFRRMLPGVGNTSTYILTVLPVIGLLFAMLYVRFRDGQRIFVLVAAVACILILLSAIVATHNRVAWLVIVVQIGVLFLFAKRPRPLVKVTLLLVAFSLASSGYVYVAMQKGKMQDVSWQSLKYSFATDDRVRLWAQVMPILEAKPWTGEGFGRRALAKSHTAFSGDILWWHAHNVFLDYAAQMGIGGVLALLFLFSAIGLRFVAYLKGPDDLLLIGLAGIAVVVGVVARNMTDDFFNRDLALLFWAEVGLLMGWAERLRKRHAIED